MSEPVSTYRGTNIYQDDAGGYICTPFELSSVEIRSQYFNDLCSVLDALQHHQLATPKATVHIQRRLEFDWNVIRR